MSLSTEMHGTEVFIASDRLGPFRTKRLFVFLAFVVLVAYPGDLGTLTRELVTDAFVQVSVFVGATLLLFYGAERLFHFDIGEVLERSRRWQVPLAALLGTMPGCGGAVVVVAAYSSGHVRFGAVVATLTATMGDAAFLLIATRPDAAIVVLPVSLTAGILSGWIIDALHGDQGQLSAAGTCQVAPKIGKARPKDYAYLILAAPGLYIGAMQLAQIEVTHIFGLPAIWLGVVGATVGMLIWSTSPLQAMTNVSDPPVTRMSEETAFISVWVIAAYLAYDYAAAYAGLDLEAMFMTIAPVLPLIAILIGFVPGCGPQVLVTTLYINGLIPFAALVGNAISNDGDALFPAIALNPRAAVLATAYSAVPATIVAYGFYFFAPTFLN